MLKAVAQTLFSSGFQKPRFTVQHTQGVQDYEVRTYYCSTWVSTTVKGRSLDSALSTGFRRLFKYINGTNQDSVKVEMTAPVTCLVEPGPGPECESAFTVSFYVPEEHQEAPPPPTDPALYIERRQEFTAYVRWYGGFSSERVQREERVKLLQSLSRDGVPHCQQRHYVAAYDSPFTLMHRRNEVWVPKEQGSKVNQHHTTTAAAAAAEEEEVKEK